MNDATRLPSNQKLLPEVGKSPDINLFPLEETLIRNVHAGHQRIIIEKEFGGNHGGARVFLVLPVNADGSRDARLVTKIGPASELGREQENYRQHVANTLPFSAAHVRGYYEQDDQAALNYDFAGQGVLGETVTLFEYYGARSAGEITATLSSLLDKSLGAWYGQSYPLNCTFRDEYGLRLPSYEEMLRVVSIIFPDLAFPERERIEIPGMDGSYPNPLKVYESLLDRMLEGRESYVHGDLHLRNVLVDQGGKGWLIDFANVAKHHVMLDFIKLETYTRLMVLAPQHRRFSWDECAQFEYTLNADTLDQSVHLPKNAHLAKAYVVIQAIRQIARKYMGPEQDFRKEYFPALFLYCLARLKHYESNGLAPTQLIFMTTCALGQLIFEEHKMMKPDPNKSKKEMSKEQAKAFRPGGVSIGGKATDNIIITGNQNKVNQTNRKVNTGGGAYVEGNVHVQNGDFVGRDKVTHTTGASADEIAAAFALLLQKVDEMRPSPAKAMAKTAVQGLEAEAKQGQRAVEENVDGWFGLLAPIAPDIWEVAVDTFANPIKGLSTVFQKIAKRAKEKKAQRGRN